MNGSRDVPETTGKKLMLRTGQARKSTQFICDKMKGWKRTNDIPGNASNCIFNTIVPLSNVMFGHPRPCMDIVSLDITNWANTRALVLSLTLRLE